MKIITTQFDGLLVIEPPVFSDPRGYLVELWKQSRYTAAGMPAMLQDNLSWSSRGVLRGLHFQNPQAQAKLVFALVGEIFDVAVDVRLGSPTFGKWFGTCLSCANKRQLFLPAGFAHGFCVLSDSALVAYKCSQEYCPETEITISWNDPQLAIKWPTFNPTLSAKDAAAVPLCKIPSEWLPLWRSTAAAA
ncbi:MAG: dTDP-4-dehydrorhamnose 3,5-epimerase [Planctomycetes bacterium]|nr:dTDP-4-dehydrorhamnose 3,5-epimerase [Planctomycetota bacterium]